MADEPTDLTGRVAHSSAGEDKFSLSRDTDPNRSPDPLCLRQMRLELWDGADAGADDPGQTRRQQIRTVRAKLAFLAAFSVNGNVRQ